MPPFENPFRNLQGKYWKSILFITFILFFIFPLSILYYSKFVLQHAGWDAWSTAILYPIVLAYVSSICSLSFIFIIGYFYFKKRGYQISISLKEILLEHMLGFGLLTVLVYIVGGSSGVIIGQWLNDIGIINNSIIKQFGNGFIFGMTALGYLLGFVDSATFLEEADQAIQKQKEAQQLLDDGKESIDSGEFEAARETLQEAKEILQAALTRRQESHRNVGLNDDIQQELNQVVDNLSTVEKNIIEDKLTSLQSNLNNIEQLLTADECDEAAERLSDVQSTLDLIKERISEYNLHEFENKIQEVERRYESLVIEKNRQRTRSVFIETVPQIRSEAEEIVALLDEREQQYKQLQDEVDTLHSKLKNSDIFVEQKEFEKAKATLDELASDIESAKTSAIQYNFYDLDEALTTLERQRETLLEDLTERLEADLVPDIIPRAPNISVEYDALTDREPIGKGGNADVTKATLHTPNGNVTLAIKEPRMAGTLHTETVERMLEEAETWDRLDDHDHIVGVIDYGSAPIPWIAMEYMDAGHLGERSGELEIPQALWTAIAVTKGVRHAHRRGVAHLDLKPENVLFRAVEEAWDVPKVADWGLSRHLLEHSKSVEGLSPQYAAPEQFDEDFGSADDITDIYQLGAVFYELFTGQPPFEGKPAKAMHKVLHEQPTPPSEIADVPDGLDEILLTALAKEKGDRYDNIVYLRDALQALYDEE